MSYEEQLGAACQLPPTTIFETMRRGSRYTVAPALAGLVLVAAAACGGDDEYTPPSPAPIPSCDQLFKDEAAESSAYDTARRGADAAQQADAQNPSRGNDTHDKQRGLMAQPEGSMTETQRLIYIKGCVTSKPTARVVAGFPPGSPKCGRDIIFTLVSMDNGHGTSTSTDVGVAVNDSNRQSETLKFNQGNTIWYTYSESKQALGKPVPFGIAVSTRYGGHNFITDEKKIVTPPIVACPPAKKPTNKR